MSAAPRLGGQALIEGVMVRAGGRWAAAARRPDGTIVTTEAEVPGWALSGRGVPVVRGMIALVATIGLGMKALSWSRSVAEEEPTPKGTVVAATLVSIAVFVSVFALVPALVARLAADRVAGGGVLFALAEALTRVALFVGYVAAIGRLPGIRRTFEYHGAEHKAIAAQEHGDELTVERVSRYSPLHARCGTDFLVLVAVVAIAAFALVSPESWLLLAASRVLLLPVVAGVAYEVLRVSDRPVPARWLKPLMAPGLAVQGLTTRPPSDDQVEVAIVAVQAAVAPVAR
ncbi:MAG: DUF1385 domain-containing protein [Acidimicrobiia bacterium]